MRRRRDHCRDRAFHIGRAAAVKQFASPFGRERRADPTLARRHHVQMAGKGKVAAAGRALAQREQILDRAIGRVAGAEPVNRKTQGFEHRLQAIEHQPGRRGHRGAGDQTFGKGCCIETSHAPNASSRTRASRSPACTIRVRATGAARASVSASKRA